MPVFQITYDTSTLNILISDNGLSISSVWTDSIELHTSMPFVTRPNTVCLLSSHGVGTVVMKNCDPLVPGPALAMDTVKGLS